VFSPAWRGYLVVANYNLSIIADALPEPEDVWVAGEDEPLVEVEPSLVRAIGEAFVSTINLANADRTRSVAPEGCDPIVWKQPVGPNETYVNARGLTGRIVVVAGYNVTAQQSDVANTITLGGVVGGGLGRPCAEVPRFEGETWVTQDGTLDGAVPCNRVLRSLNGVGVPDLQLSGGLGVGVSVEYDVVREVDKIVVDIGRQGLDSCFIEVSEVV
jgi:hypothetical protein